MPLFAQLPTPPNNTWIEGVRSCETAHSRVRELACCNPQSANPPAAQSSATGAREKPATPWGARRSA
eukprot:316040-Alexandrium_andersonii.AAC.1